MSIDAQTIHIWLPGIREGSGGIQNFCRDLIRSITDTYPDASLHLNIKNDAPEPDDPLIGPRVTWTSSENVPLALRSPSFALAGANAARRSTPVLIISCHVNFLPAVGVISHFFNVPYTTFIYGIDAWKTLSLPVRMALKRADRIFSISSYTTKLAIAAQRLGEKSIHFIPCTFNTQRYQPLPKSQDLLARYSIQSDQQVLLTISRLAISERYKGHEEVLHALPEVRKHFPKIKYLIGGKGPYADSLKQTAQDLGVQDLVIFTGFIPNNELAAHYQLCDVFIMPSQKEGFGIVFLEAMACGKPVIAGNIDGSVDALDGGRLGVLVNPTDPAQIASCILEVLSASHPNKLLFQPQALQKAVIETFGTAAFNARIKDALAPFLSLPEKHSDSKVAISMQPSVISGPRITVLTQLTSPYQVEFFNAIAGQNLCHLSVVYLTSQDRNRHWHPTKISHHHIILSEAPEARNEAMEWLLNADLAVFNYYTDPFPICAIHRRYTAGKPWVFWGERPGALLLGWPTILFRRLALMPLALGTSPIWGIGRFALEGYKADFGDARIYRNLPYFSNLDRFSAQPRRPEPGTIRFLFSGTLSKRKGSDLLAKAFVHLAREYPQARLTLVGTGPLEQKLKSLLAPVINQVEFKGFTNWENLPHAYSRANVFCFPSRYDGWGLALVEAMASGLPVISTPLTGSAREFLTENVNGWMVTPGDSTSLYNAMRSAMTAPLGTMGQAASRSVADHTLARGVHRFIEAARLAIASDSSN